MIKIKNQKENMMLTWDFFIDIWLVHTDLLLFLSDITKQLNKKKQVSTSAVIPNSITISISNIIYSQILVV